MCKYQVIKDALLICTVTKQLCDFCIFGTQNHFKDGEKMNEKENEQ